MREASVIHLCHCLFVEQLRKDVDAWSCGDLVDESSCSSSACALCEEEERFQLGWGIAAAA